MTSVVAFFSMLRSVVLGLAPHCKSRGHPVWLQSFTPASHLAFLCDDQATRNVGCITCGQLDSCVPGDCQTAQNASARHSADASLAQLQISAACYCRRSARSSWAARWRGTCRAMGGRASSRVLAASATSLSDAGRVTRVSHERLVRSSSSSGSGGGGDSSSSSSSSSLLMGIGGVTLAISRLRTWPAATRNMHAARVSN